MRHLFDINTVNPGDVAIGQVMASSFKDHNIDFTQGGPESEDEDLMVIGGGHLLQPYSEEYYRGFRRKGNHILYSVGVSGGIGAVRYLGAYRMVSVRTKKDKALIREAGNVKVIPCPANLLPIEDCGLDISGGIGIQTFYPGYPQSYIERFQKSKEKIISFPWRRSIRGETVDDLIGAKWMADELGATLLPTDLTPGQLRDVIQRLDLFICQSLHAAMWAYQSGVPFLVHNYSPKITFWASERNLMEHTFDKPWRMKMRYKKPPDERARYDRELAEQGLDMLCQEVKRG